MKFKILKAILHGKKIHAAGKTIDLDHESDSTKKLLTTGHIADPKAKPAQEGGESDEEKNPKGAGTGAGTVVKLLALLALIGSLFMPRAEAVGTNLFTLPLPNYELINFTNMLAGVGGLKNTNTLFEFTNGTTTVTSSWVALNGEGFDIVSIVSPTNALLTNIVFSLRFSPDGTNVLNEPATILFRTATAAIAAGKYCYSTNFTKDTAGSRRFVQLYQVFITNGVNTVGSVFCTNNGPTFAVGRFKRTVTVIP